MKLLLLLAVYWWVFLILMSVALLAKTEVYSQILQAASKYDGSYWWIWLIALILFGLIRLFLSQVNVQ